MNKTGLWIRIRIHGPFWIRIRIHWPFWNRICIQNADPDQGGKN